MDGLPISKYAHGAPNRLRQQTINDFEIDLPKDNIGTILKDPQKWGEEVAESFILSFVPKFLKAKKAGRELATKLKEVND